MEQLSFAKVFLKESQFHDIATKALISRLRWALARQRLWPDDAFRQIDANRDGQLTRTELQKGLEWLKLDKVVEDPTRWSAQIQALFEYIDKDGNSKVNAQEFKAAMELDDMDWESVPDAMRPGDAHSPTGRIPLRLSLERAAQSLDKRAFERLTCGRFKLEWQRHTAFEAVWTSKGSLVESPLSIWDPTGLDTHGFLNEVRERLCFGHLARVGFKTPNHAVLEITDEQESGFWKNHSREDLNILLKTIFPNPVQFRQVWSRTVVPGSGASPLYIWRPVPPTEDHVAIGVLATTEATEPSASRIRCVPRAWAEQLSEDTASRFWHDSAALSLATFWGHKLAGTCVLFNVSSSAQAHVMPATFVLMEEPQKSFLAAISSSGGSRA